MDLLDLFVKIGVKDEASKGIAQVSDGAIGKLVRAAKGAAKALAGMWGVKKVVEFGKAAFDAYSSFEQLQGGVAKLYGNAGMSIEEYAQSVGKSVGEVTEAYQRNEKAQAQMMQNAQNAWKTAGMDANTYMESVTGFSSALINSLGGDTEKAAKIADMAMQDISDNANTFGKYTVEELTDVYQNLAKGQYQTLDNLNLGFGGTKEGLQQLIDKAKELSGVDYDASNFADIAQAIHVIQENAKIAGTTQREAMYTIEGSMNATKAAWQNLVAEFGKPDANVSARVGDLFDAVFGVVDEKTQEREGGLFKNVTSEVGTIAQNMIRAAGDGLSIAIDWIASNAPRLVTNAMKSIGDAIGNAASSLGSFTENFNLVDAIFGEGGAGETASKALEWIQGLGQTFSDNWPYIQEQLGNLWNQVVETAQTYGPQIMEVAGRLLTMAGDAIREHAPELLAKVGELIGNLLAHLGTFSAQMVSKGRELIMGIVTGTSDEGKNLRKWFSDFFPDGLLRGLGDFATFLLDAGRSLINGLLDGIGEVAPDVEQAIRDAFDKVLAFFGGVADFIKDPVGSIKNGLESLGGSFDSTADGIEKDTGRAEGGIKRLDRAKLSDKKAKATVTGNAVDGKGRSAIDKTDASVKKLKDKSVSVTVNQKGLTATMIGSLKQQIDRLRDKSVTVTTTQKTITKKEKAGGAWGGITPRYHATGGVRIADRYGEGEPLDIVGERGPEAIVPLTSHYGKDFAQMMGREAAKEMGGGRPVVNIYMTYNAGEDATQLVSDLAAGLELVL